MTPAVSVSMRVCGRFLVMTALGVAVLGAVSVAEAEPVHHYAVKWTTGDGGASCRQAAELGAAVGKLVSSELLSGREQADRIIVGTASRSSSWLALLSVQDAAGNVLGERELKSDAATCAELDDSVALAIALIIDPERRFPAQSASSPPPAAPAPPAPAAATVAAPARVPEAPARPYRAAPARSLKGAAVALAGVLPDIAPGAQLELWLPIAGAHSVRFAVTYFGAQTKGVPERSDVVSKLYLGTARAAYCPLLIASPRYSAFGCAGLEFGLMVAHGRGGGYARTPARALLALDAALTVDRALAGPWALSATAGGALIAIRPKVSYQTESDPILVHRSGVLEGRLEIGLAYRF